MTTNIFWADSNHGKVAPLGLTFFIKKGDSMKTLTPFLAFSLKEEADLILIIYKLWEAGPGFKE